MAPESVSNLIALDLEWTNSRIECQVDRYDLQNDFLYVSWNAIECPENYVPIGNDVAYVWIPPGSIHRRYRARVDAVKNGYEWVDRADAGNGAMLILTLPPDYVFIYPDENPPVQYPVRFKPTKDNRMALYWWLPPGRFVATWDMEHTSNADIEINCQLLNEEARNRFVKEPDHIDRLHENNPSAQPNVINEPPKWHLSIQARDHATVVLGNQEKRKVNVKVKGDKFENIRNSIISTRGSIASGIIKVRDIEGKEVADALQQLDEIISQVKPDEMSDDQKEKALKLLEELTKQAASPNKTKAVLEAIGNGLWKVVKNVDSVIKTSTALWSIIQKLWS